MKSIITLLTLISLGYLSLTGQNFDTCADEQLILPTLRQHLRQETGQARTDQYVPLVFRIIGHDNGYTDVRYTDIYEAVCQTNTYLAGSGLQFYVLSIDQPVNSHALQQAPLLNHEVFVALKHPQALNVFLISEEISEETSLYLYGSYTSIQGDYILMEEQAIREHPSFLAHQLGHAFKLIHPYRDWVGIGFMDLTDYYDLSGQTPAVDSINGMPVELADGSNCETTGDWLCDTPPDYFFGIPVMNCPSELLIMDANSDSIPWMPANVMGSFLDCPADTYYFSEQQTQVMYTDFLSAERDYLRELLEPTLVDNSTAPTLLSPFDGELINCDYMVSWEMLPNINQYVLEVSRVSIFTVDYQQFIVSDTSFQFDMTMLQEDRTYYWRVSPVAAGLDCSAGSSEVFSFTVPFCDVATQDIEQLLDWRIVQNPSPAGQASLLSLDMETAADIVLEIHTLNGQKLYQTELHLNTGYNTVAIPTQPLTRAVYLVSLRKEGHITTKKMLIY